MDALFLVLAGVLGLFAGVAFARYRAGDPEAILYTLGYTAAALMLTVSAVT
jgi:hydrogenase/urease accessory protein HupE